MFGRKAKRVKLLHRVDRTVIDQREAILLPSMAIDHPDRLYITLYCVYIVQPPEKYIGYFYSLNYSNFVQSPSCANTLNTHRRHINSYDFSIDPIVIPFIKKQRGTEQVEH